MIWIISSLLLRGVLQGEHHSGESSLEHAGAIVNNESGNVLVMIVSPTLHLHCRAWLLVTAGQTLLISLLSNNNFSQILNKIESIKSYGRPSKN